MDGGNMKLAEIVSFEIKIICPNCKNNIVLEPKGRVRLVRDGDLFNMCPHCNFLLFIDLKVVLGVDMSEVSIYLERFKASFWK